MRSRLVLLLALIVVPFAMQFNGAAAAPHRTGSVSGRAVLPNCAVQPAATVQATQAATLPATVEATAQATSAATMQAAGPLLRFVTFEPTDFKFNPNADKPVALVIVFSLVFESESDAELPVKHPRLKLAIDGVPWGDVSSTDFQQGILRAHATQGIVLQSLLLVPGATADQKAMLECIKNGVPVDLMLTGTFEVYPGGEKQLVDVSFLTPQAVIRAHK